MRTFIIFIILILMIPSLSYAESANVLLDKYGMLTLPTKSVAKQELDTTKNEYYQTSRIVSDKVMLNTANNVSKYYAKQKLEDMDKEIYKLESNLKDITSEIDSAGNSKVSTILELNSKYLSIKNEISQDANLRNLWVKSEKLSDEYVPKDTQYAYSKLIQVKKELKTKEDVYNKVSSAPDLGNISNFKEPLAVEAPITSGFGWRVNPLNKKKMGFHAGMDFGVPVGTKVLAAFNGVVLKAAWEGDIGNYIVLSHGDNIETLYGHLSKILVKDGQKVKQYQEIGLSGDTGWDTTGPHLHFGIFIDGKPVNPGVIVNK